MHCDIKPENIFVLTDDQQNQTFLLGDFGEAIFLNEPHTLPCGTLGFMAPEVMAKKIDFDSRVDIWAIAVVVAEKALGVDELFVSDNIAQEMRQCKTRSLSGNPAVNEILQSMLEINPKDRPFASDLIKKLEEKSTDSYVGTSARGKKRRKTSNDPQKKSKQTSDGQENNPINN